MKSCFQPNQIEIGLDEAGRGCLFGPVFTAGVVWDGSFHPDIRDSKKLSESKRQEMKQYIEKHSLHYSVTPLDNHFIDTHNILHSTISGWHTCIRKITQDIPVDLILVDGPNFDFYIDKDDEIIPHQCVNKGDDLYLSIAAASILAKTYRDEWICQLVETYPELNKYNLKQNKGYGTKDHRDAIRNYGITPWHRQSFGICKQYAKTNNVIKNN